MRRFSFLLCCVLSLAPLACEDKPELTAEELQARIAQKLEEADIRQRNNKPKDAEAIYQWILSQQANHPGALRGLAQVRLSGGDVAAALDLCKQAEAAGSTEASLFETLARIHGKEGRFTEAATAWGKAYELDPTEARHGLEQGIALRLAKQHAEAEAVLRKVADQEPEVQFVFTELGDTLREQERFDEALKLYMKAQSIFASDRRAHAGAAMVYEQRGETTKAINEWSSYIRMDCCSDFSNDTAKPKLEALRQREQAELAADEAPSDEPAAG